MILDEPKKYYDPSKSIFNDADDGEKVEILKGLIQNLNKKNDGDIRKVLINVYGKIEASKSKKDIHIILFSNGIYISELIKDLLTVIYEKHDKDFFDVLFNTYTSHENLSIKYSGKTDDKSEEPQTRKASDKRYDQYDQWKEQQKHKLGKTSDKLEEPQKRKTLKNGSKYSFEKVVNDVLRDLEYSQKVKFVKYITSEARSKPEEKRNISSQKSSK